MKTTTYTVTAENIDKESYYNCVRLCEITGYANPILAIKESAARGFPLTWEVYKDEHGNITGKSYDDLSRVPPGC